LSSAWKTEPAGTTGAALAERLTLEREWKRLRRLPVATVLEKSIVKEAVVRLERSGER